jgi:hypothetical protein
LGFQRGSACLLRSLGVVFSVVRHVTALTHCFEVVVAAVLGSVVEVRDGKRNCFAGVIGFEAVEVWASPSMRPASAFTFASAICADEADSVTDTFPVLGVPGAVFGTYRHQQIPSASACLSGPTPTRSVHSLTSPSDANIRWSTATDCWVDEFGGSGLLSMRSFLFA